MKQACAIITCFVAVCNAIAGPDTAKQILDATGAKGGLIVHLGCGDGELTAALHANNSCVVQGLDTDPRNVDAARKHIQSLGIYGKVSADLFDGKQLPYVDDCVNLIVASGGTGVTQEEMLRVLAPGGVALFGGKEIVKPRPEAIDDWTHFMHGADNNAVAQDTVVDKPRRIRWVGDPKHSRSHHFHCSISTMVSAGGRLFTIIDEGPTYLFNQTPARWSLVARDAFNGVTLWRVPIKSWVPVHQGGGGHTGRFMFAPDLFRRLVATDVFETAEFMTSYAHENKKTGKYDLGPWVMNAAENNNRVKDETINPAFELAYWRYGLGTACQWRQRMGLPVNREWKKVRENLAPLPVEGGVYVMWQGVPDMWTQYNHSHIDVIGAGAFLPNRGVDVAALGRTVEKAFQQWDMASTWGWDFPWLAMAAARAGKPEKAVDALFLRAVHKNEYSLCGINRGGPAHAYFPGNGGLLYAVAMMAAGWDGGPDKPAPGFPGDGTWIVRHEGLMKAQ